MKLAETMDALIDVLEARKIPTVHGALILLMLSEITFKKCKVKPEDVEFMREEFQALMDKTDPAKKKKEYLQ